MNAFGFKPSYQAMDLEWLKDTPAPTSFNWDTENQHSMEQLPPLGLVTGCFDHPGSI